MRTEENKHAFEIDSVSDVEPGSQSETMVCT